MRLSSFTLHGSIIVTTALFVGCSSNVGPSRGTVCPATDYNCTARTALQYRQQADRYGALADRYQKEAEYRAAQLGENSPEVQGQRQLAQQYLAQSEEADALARQFRRELPHGVMQH